MFERVLVVFINNNFILSTTIHQRIVFLQVEVEGDKETEMRSDSQMYIKKGNCQAEVI